MGSTINQVYMEDRGSEVRSDTPGGPRFSAQRLIRAKYVQTHSIGLSHNIVPISELRYCSQVEHSTITVLTVCCAKLAQAAHTTSHQTCSQCWVKAYLPMIDESVRHCSGFGPLALISLIENCDATAGDTYIHLSYNRVKVVI